VDIEDPQRYPSAAFGSRCHESEDEYGHDSCFSCGGGNRSKKSGNKSSDRHASRRRQEHETNIRIDIRPQTHTIEDEEEDKTYQKNQQPDYEDEEKTDPRGPLGPQDLLTPNHEEDPNTCSLNQSLSF